MISGSYSKFAAIICVLLNLSSCRFDEEVWCHDLRDLRREVAQRRSQLEFDQSRGERAPASVRPFMPSQGVPYEDRIKFEREDGQRWSEGILKRLDEVRVLSETHPRLRASLPAIKNATFELTIFHGRVSKPTFEHDRILGDLGRLDAIFKDVEHRDCPKQ